MMPKFVIKGFLREARLAEIIGALVPDRFVPQFKIDERQFRWDIKYETPKGRYLVEYDGDEHYRNTVVIRSDEEKDRLARANGFTSVRFPYWLQLDSFTLEHFFGLSAEIDQMFPHGFITTKLFPASFCEKGVARFAREFGQLPEHLRVAVLSSLRDRAAELGAEYVLPTPLQHLWDSKAQQAIAADRADRPRSG
jgi:hypothetical protein